VFNIANDLNMLKFLYVLLLVTFLVPTINLGGIPIRVEDVFFIGIVVLYPKRVLSILRDPLNQVYFWVLGLLILSSILSLLISIFQGYIPILQDVNSIFVLVRNFLIFTVGLVVGRRIIILSENLLAVLSVGFLVSALISIIQYYNFFGLGEVLYLIYGSERRILYGITRAIGSVGNPNNAAFFQSIGYILLLIVGMPKTSFKKIIYIVSFVLIVLSILITFSRTGLVAIIFVSIVYFGHTYRSKGILVPIVCFIIVGYSALSFFSNSRYSELFVDGGSVDLTFNNRLDVIWAKRIDQFLDNPFFGIGTQKATESNTIFSVTTFDNSFLLLLTTTGFVGAFIYFMFFYFVIYYFRSRRRKYFGIYLYFVLFHILILIYFLTTDLSKNVYFHSYYYFSTGLLISYTRINPYQRKLA
jgi:O-antigen ligase